MLHLSVKFDCTHTHRQELTVMKSTHLPMHNTYTCTVKLNDRLKMWQCLKNRMHFSASKHPRYQGLNYKSIISVYSQTCDDRRLIQKERNGEEHF